MNTTNNQNPQQKARDRIDQPLIATGWVVVQNANAMLIAVAFTWTDPVLRASIKR